MIGCAIDHRLTVSCASCGGTGRKPSRSLRDYEDKGTPDKEVFDQLVADPEQMPRRYCSVHDREEFKYESLEHELHAAAAPPASKEEEAQGWQPIETAPKDGTEILLVWHWDSGIHKGVTVVTARWYCRTHAHKSSVRNCPNEPDCKMGWDTYAGKMTHWMPLPPAPVVSDRDPEG